MVSDNMKNVDDMDATVDDRYGIYICSYPYIKLLIWNTNFLFYWNYFHVVLLRILRMILCKIIDDSSNFKEYLCIIILISTISRTIETFGY